jgi:two-component system NarL family sensor kinase
MFPEPAPLPDNERLKRRNRELRILNAIAEALNREVDVAQALTTALARVTELFDLRTGWVWLWNDASETPYLAAAQHLPPGLANNPAKLEGSCYCLDTYQLGQLEGAANISFITCSRLKELGQDNAGLRYHASIPLYHHDRKVGVLNVARPDWQELSDDDLRLLSTVGDLLSIALERAQLFGKSVQLGAVEERNRLAREIHDTLAQGLAAITLQLETADALIDADPQRAGQALRQALKLARANLDDARRSVMDLRAAPLEGRTLVEAVRRLAAEFAQRTNIPVQLDDVGGQRPLPIRIETGVYRIVQEALTNVERHAAAQNVILNLTITPAEIMLEIDDDGRGFDPDALTDHRFGLVGINERARLMGGSLSLYSEPGEGTTLSVRIPLEQNP